MSRKRRNPIFFFLLGTMMIKNVKIIHQTYFLQGGLKQESWGIIINNIPYCVFDNRLTLDIFLKNLKELYKWS